MNIQRLIYFNSVARLLNFTKAAHECHIAQTAMSRQIALIESEIGVPLFERSGRGVRLTCAGEVFYKESEELVDQYASMVQKTLQAAKGLTGTLRIGFGQYEHTFVTQIITLFRNRYPEIDVFVHQYNYKQLLQYFDNGTLDVIFAVPVGISSAPEEISAHKVCSSAVCLIASANHPLAVHDSLMTEALNNETLITLNEDDGPFSVDNLKALLVRFNAYPQKVVIANSLESQILMVESDLGVALFPDICKKHLTPQIKAMHLKDFISSDFSALIKNNNTNPAAQSFFGLILSTAISTEIHQG